MNIIFKQVIDGLVHTTTVTLSKPPCSPYISIDGREYPVIYQGLDVLELSGANPDTGLPMHFEANLDYYFREGNEKGIRSYYPEIQELDLIQGIQLAQKAALVHRLTDQNGHEVTPWLTLFSAVKKQAQAYWQSRIAQLKAIPDGTYWLTPEPEINEEESYFIRIDDGEEQLVTIDTYCSTEGSLTVNTGDAEYILFSDRETAGKAARAYWEDMARNDPKEFTCIVGSDTLISWALGNPDGPGSVKVDSLDEWLDLYLDSPEQHWAGYDGTECKVEVSPAIEDEYGYYTVAYRTR
jgi:hypothetical protein